MPRLTECTCVRKEEIVFLVVSFLREERQSFPQTLESFEREAADFLKLKCPSMKSLRCILEEYLALQEKEIKREELNAIFQSNHTAEHVVTTVFENIVTLLDDYCTVRKSFLESGNKDANLTVSKRRGYFCAQEGGRKECKDLAYDVDNQNAENFGERHGQTGRSLKRRKSTPSRTISAAVCGHADNSSILHKNGAAVRQDDNIVNTIEPAQESYSTDLPSIYSDISESLLSDPEVTRLFQDSANSLEDLFSVLGDADFTSRLVEPITQHINAKLAPVLEEAATRPPSQPAGNEPVLFTPHPSVATSCSSAEANLSVHVNCSSHPSLSVQFNPDNSMQHSKDGSRQDSATANSAASRVDKAVLLSEQEPPPILRHDIHSESATIPAIAATSTHVAAATTKAVPFTAVSAPRTCSTEAMAMSYASSSLSNSMPSSNFDTRPAAAISFSAAAHASAASSLEAMPHATMTPPSADATAIGKAGIGSSSASCALGDISLVGMEAGHRDRPRFPDDVDMDKFLSAIHSAAKR